MRKQLSLFFGRLLNGKSTATFAIAVVGCMTFALPSARAEIVSIAAAGFVQQCPCVGGSTPEIDRGVLVANGAAKYFASVPFPTNGQRICSLSMVYHDTNANDALEARLLRKVVVPGSSAAFNTPTILAKVSSAPGVSQQARKVTSTDIDTPVITKQSAFYYVEITVPTVNLNLIGIQIDYRPTCP